MRRQVLQAQVVQWGIGINADDGVPVDIGRVVAQTRIRFSANSSLSFRYSFSGMSVAWGPCISHWAVCIPGGA